MKLLYWGLVATLAVLLAAFAVANRQTVSLGLWPLPFALDLPLYLAVLAPLLLGFFAGQLAAWIAFRRRRRELRRGRRQIAALERELSARQALLDARAGPPPQRLPAAG